MATVRQPAGGLYGDPALARFYDLPGRPRPDLAFCRALAKEAGSVLDLGCGTGALAADIAIHAGQSAVTGVDCATAMLDIARRRPGGERVTWIEADARSVRLGRVFDLVVLTGHGFQVFLTAEDRLAALRTVAAHLGPGGRFVFDTRNPSYPGRKERRRDETLRRIEHPDLGTIETWNTSSYDEATGVLTYANSYRVVATGALHSAEERIRYTGQAELAGLIAEAGLAVETWYGDWLGHPFDPESPEIIPLGRRHATTG